MKFFVLTKQKIIVAACCTVALVFAAVICSSSYNHVIETSAVERKMPIYSVQTSKKVVSITFDTAWSDDYTKSILDILQLKNIKSTFFVTGQWTEKYGETLKIVANAGHDVGNYSNTYTRLTELQDDTILKELNDCNEKIETLTGKRPVLCRTPYGDYNNNILKITTELDMYCLRWNIDSLDWKSSTPKDIVDTIQQNLKPGSIILMHNGAKNTVEALPAVIDKIKAQGYEIVPVSELLPKGNYYTDNEGKMNLSESSSSDESLIQDSKKESDGSAVINDSDIGYAQSSI